GRRCTRLWRLYHETYSIVLCEGAPGSHFQWTYRGRKHWTRKPCLTMMEPGEVHAVHRITDPSDFQALLISPKTLQSAAEELGSSSPDPHFKIPLTYDPRM